MMPNIRTISIDELDNLGIDENNKLYWNKQPLVIEEKIHLQLWVNIAIVIGALSTVVLGSIELLRFFGYGA